MVYADRLMRLLAEEALCRLPSIEEDGEVETPVGTAREGGATETATSETPKIMAKIRTKPNSFLAETIHFRKRKTVSLRSKICPNRKSLLDTGLGASLLATEILFQQKMLAPVSKKSSLPFSGVVATWRPGNAAAEDE